MGTGIRSRRAHRLAPVNPKRSPFKLGKGQVLRACSCGEFTTVSSEAGARAAHARHVAEKEGRPVSDPTVADVPVDTGDEPIDDDDVAALGKTVAISCTECGLSVPVPDAYELTHAPGGVRITADDGSILHDCIPG